MLTLNFFAKRFVCILLFHINIESRYNYSKNIYYVTVISGPKAFRYIPGILYLLSVYELFYF